MKWVKRGGQRVPPDTKTAGVGTAGGADLRVSGGGGGVFNNIRCTELLVSPGHSNPDN